MKGHPPVVGLLCGGVWLVESLVVEVVEVDVVLVLHVVCHGRGAPTDPAAKRAGMRTGGLEGALASHPSVVRRPHLSQYSRSNLARLHPTLRHCGC